MQMHHVHCCEVSVGSGEHSSKEFRHEVFYHGIFLFNMAVTRGPLPLGNLNMILLKVPKV